ncbi:MAG: succinate dehydrogenase, cytochrome b556 subunit [Armatimonadetes bacterium CG_4_10_14_3_um_filter_66_18]|nr:MAG: succinate dehydrogenase, cytochrome b556 subunit [Armatimonadetes bacterium CG_4_8_14_3_um_filter_66_20]PIY39138.1 MAG: succinate dehydrogenase, cytochrome b556 subunit [Armatimonadetes bacterium CG_4_10_14_3_um_filter_66_18]PIZ41259.1 MAG: succinate dehydrogenase, cytochrome b556 subunit [Armatimonadetes bacterium CG_4_10_14_0_8_um_filter_66_14]
MAVTRMPETDRQTPGISNQQGVKGWAVGGRYGFNVVERYAYTLHRITGLALLCYLIPHLFVTGQRLRGAAVWEPLRGFLGQPLFHFLEFLVFMAFAYHVLNGARLVVTELGFCLGKPRRPVYPHVSCVQRQRPLFLGMMALAFLVCVAGFVEFFFLH